MSDSMDFPRNDQLVIDLGGVHNPMEPLVMAAIDIGKVKKFPPKRNELLTMLLLGRIWTWPCKSEE